MSLPFSSVVLKEETNVALFELEEDVPKPYDSNKIEQICRISTCKMTTKTTIVLLFLVFLVSIFVAIFFNIINAANDANNLFIPNDSTIEADLSNPQVQLNEKFGNLFWFVHVTDTHFNVYNHKNRSKDLENFCHNILPMINPSVLVLTGDITDSRSPDPMGSDQHQQEWLTYNMTRHLCMEDNPNMKWLDIRGNHDNFNVYNSYNNYYKNFTVQGNMSEAGKSYRYEVVNPNRDSNIVNRYSFIAVDACLTPGIRRPFNFIGKLDSNELKRIERLKEESAHTNYTIWFGHYPTGSIANANDLRPLINGPYLCGHYHNFHGVTPQMISTQSQGYLEAELGDWKDNRRYRIGAIDGDLFTFVDFDYKRHYSDVPLIVITNPRSVLHQMELFEPFWRVYQSTHIRVLIFSSSKILHTSICISKMVPKSNGNNHDCLDTMELTHVHGPLWVASWSPIKYQKGLFYITVTATNNHHTNEVSNPFSLDRSKPSYTVTGRISLRVSFQSIGFVFFLGAITFSLLPLYMFKLFTKNDIVYFRHMYNLSRRSYMRKLLFKLYIVSHVEKLFYPLMIMPTYICFGPWFIGRFVRDAIGISFLWGTYIEGQILPVSFTYIFAGLFLYVFHIPFLASIACLVYSRCIKFFNEAQHRIIKEKNSIDGEQSIKSQLSQKGNCCDFEWFNVLFIVLVVLLQALSSTIYYFAYGSMAMATNVFIWFSLIYAILLTATLKLRPEDFQNWL